MRWFRKTTIERFFVFVHPENPFSKKHLTNYTIMPMLLSSVDGSQELYCFSSFFGFFCHWEAYF